MDCLCDHIDHYKRHRHLIITHEKFIERPWDHRCSCPEKRKEIEKCDQKSHEDKISCSKHPQTDKQDHKYDRHDLKLRFEISSHSIPQIIDHKRHPFLYRFR